MTGMEVANTVVQISTGFLSGPNGIPFVIGKGGAVYMHSYFASGINRLAVLTNQATYLTTFADSTSSPTWKNYGILVLGHGQTQYMNRSGYVLSAQPSILIESDMQDETLVKISGMQNLFPHNGFSDASDMYYIENNSNYADIRISDAELNVSSNPLYLRQPYNLSKLKNCTMSGKIIYSSGEQSVAGGAKYYKATGDQLTPSNPLSNSSKVIMRYYMEYDVTSGGSISVLKNGYAIFRTTQTGKHSVEFDLLPGETATATFDTSLVSVSDYNTAYLYA